MRAWPLSVNELPPERPAGALDAFAVPAPRKDLTKLSLVDLSNELLARLAAGETYESSRDLIVAGQLHDLLDGRLDVHLNRYARRRFADLVQPMLARIPLSRLKDATVVELGSGSLNPFVFGFLFVMLGARRAYAVDLEPVQDLGRAVRALAKAAEWFLIDSSGITGTSRMDPREVLDNLAGFDLAKLAAGDAAGIDSSRLIYRLQSIHELALQEPADLISSVSVLEHLDRLDAVLERLYRLSRPDGIGHHVVDFIDHRIYGGEVSSPFEFLTIDTTDPLVHGSNRIRHGQLVEMFEQHGFAVEHVDPCRTDPLSDAERQRFVEPYRSMRREDLTMVCARYFLRRR